ncbi:AMP-binding enzyme [Mycolicibacterium sp. HS_4_1]
MTYGVLDRSFASIATAARGLGWSGTDEVAAELITYVRDRIARGNAPRTVYFVDRLPRLATGKLTKRKLQEQYPGARR